MSSVEIVTLGFIYASVPAALIVSGLLYFYLGGDRYPARCLLALSAPMCIAIIIIYMSAGPPRSFVDVVISPITHVVFALLLGQAGVLGSGWGWRWRLAFAIVLTEETFLTMAMIGAF